MHGDDLAIRNPCEADWDAMTGSATRRFCDHCQQHVHDLSAMTRAEAGAVLASGGDTGGHPPCIRYRTDTRGRVLFAPSQAAIVPASALRRRVRPAHAAVVTVALAACTPHGKPPPPPEMGAPLEVVTEPVAMGQAVAKSDPVPEPQVVLGEFVPQQDEEPLPCDGGAQPTGDPAKPVYPSTRMGKRVR